jgi:hypothetical protein
VIYQLIFIFLFISTISAQISNNIFSTDNYDLSNIGESYQWNLDDHLYNFKDGDSTILGIDLNAKFSTGAVDYYENYNDNTFYQLAPFMHYTTIPNFTFDLRVNIENIRDDYVYPQRTFWGDEFFKHRGYYDIAKIEYQSKYFSAKLGRDYFMPGVYLYENLLFSKYNYAYDQIAFEFKNKYFTLSSYYLSPNTVSVADTIYQRHINGHRLTINLGNGYIALNDVMVYGGVNKSIDLLAFNPLQFLYPYRKNKKHLDGNNLMSLEFYYKIQDYYLFTELLLDDYQADKEVPTDLEPPEWGINTTFGIDNLTSHLDWRINYTKVANRTFNAPDFIYEKYIFNNYPIGHFLGNNFREIKSSFIYKPQQDYIFDLTFYYLEAGEEALYAPFNKDFENYSVKQGYTEAFPFGTISTQSGATLKAVYTASPRFIVKSQMGYWFKNNRLKEKFGFSLQLAYRFSTNMHSF